MTAQGISERRAGRQARGTSLQREVRRGIRGVEDRCSAPCPNSGCLMFDQPNRVPPNAGLDALQIPPDRWPDRGRL